MESKLASYLAPRLEAEDGVAISNLFRIPGGASRETWMFDAAWRAGGEAKSAPFVLRMDPPASLVESEREVEYAFYRAFEGTNVPVPRMRWLELGLEPLGAPFFIMDRITVGETNVQNLASGPQYDGARAMIGRRMYEVLAAIHTAEWSGTDIPKVVKPPTPATCWREALDYWEGMIDANELSPQPIIRAAIRWLRANPPPPAQRVSVVHGDYRVGNFLYSNDGIHGVLDWEMAHLGDPIEDVAWAMHEIWHRDLIPRAECIAVYEEASGLKVAPEALRWWDVFTGVKAQGIWLTGARSFQEGRSSELILVAAAYSLVNRTDEAVLQSLGRGA
ncbi:MAG: phosphotransferase family protein [Anaerolinea sp.]|nr:phosphotransferase family protein [Anaerolinea sp.]